MAIQLYNTLTRTKEQLQTREPGKVGLYVCGVTAYDMAHIGHARAYVAFDAVCRYLRQAGYELTYVRNFTDVDDKIIARATERGEDPLALSTRYIDEFYTDMDALGCLRPDIEPKVSDHMEPIVRMVQGIIDRGHAYVVDGDVFFDVQSFPGYGKLSGRNLDDNRAGERVAIDDRKRHPADFALWKTAKPGEPRWSSPWGDGRPGWHIECSAMSCAHLGTSFDIHGGGKDLVFPHHENEIAQSEAANGQPYVRYWMHNGFVNIDSEKMSKSLGNFFTIREVCRLYHPQAIRYFLLSTHYRAPINYTERHLEEASARVYYLYKTLVDLETALAGVGAGEVPDDGPPLCQEVVGTIETGLRQAMDDDFNTACATGVLSEPLKIVNDLVCGKKGKKKAGRLRTLAMIRDAIRPVLDALGVGTAEAHATLGEMRRLALARQGIGEGFVDERIAGRVRARQERDWARADEIRDELLAKRVRLMDIADGTVWCPVYDTEDELACG